MREGIFTKRNGNRGMSLVELMTVMVILSVVMLAVMSLYIPAQRSTVTQTQVSDVQSNLRLALRVMSRDLLMAGFLMPFDPIVFPDAPPSPNGPYSDNPDNFGTKNYSEFIIRTRSVGNGFARIISAQIDPSNSNQIILNIAQGEMITSEDGIDMFPMDSRVRLFAPVAAGEINADKGSDPDRAFPVKDFTANTIIIDISALSLSVPEKNELVTELLPETVVVRIKDATQPPLQTIHYKLTNGVLQRIVNKGAPQLLARNIDTSDTDCTSSTVTSCFDYNVAPDGRINRVDIKLSGITAAGKAGTLSEQKTREVQTSVKLRNVN